ncbi:chloride channel [Leucosporidium creatinivorum]|uniref:Chloride channel n=1 Tax=Leucosporidium creatinivorum TaxID=106004 RepID=A0A1Y2EU07_9BASI|nr:chloride channel [Leucosporidium creatinivorum]
MPSHQHTASPPPLSTSTASLPARALDSPSAAAADERRPLLRTARSESLFRATASLKRKSAVVSDFISGRHHSSAAPAGGGGGGYWPEGERWEEEGGDEESVRGMARGMGTGYDGMVHNFHTIDWVHDAVKESFRRRKLRTRKRTEGVRGLIANLWDGSQGWILVTVIGLLTALIAFGIISTEMLLFDLKDGYCTRNARLPKRFCCKSVGPALGRRAVGGGGMKVWSQVMVEECRDWTTWGEVWSAWTGGGGEGEQGVVNYLAFILIAIIFSTTASTLTIYLTSSTSVYSSKDSPSMPHPGFSPDFPSLPIPTRAAVGSSTTYGTLGGGVENGSAEDGEGATGGKDEDEPSISRPRKTLYFAAGSGIPEIKTILSGFVIRGYLGSWTLATKSVGLALSVASGLSLGKEGPFVHIASCVGNISSRFFPKYDRNEAKRREIISAACAAGVAVSFGAPVGGTLFSLEEVSYFFPPRTMVRSFWCAMIAAMSLKILDPFGSGKIVLFAVTYDRDWHTFELVGFLFLGIFGGVYGALFCKANIWWTKHVRNGTFLKVHPIVEVALITLITVCVSFYNPWTKMGGTELVYELFSECHTGNSFGGLCIDVPEQVWGLVGSIFFALVMKALLTVVTFGIKLPAGIFIPTLAVGACAGRIAGLLIELLHARHPSLAIFEACRSSYEDGPLPFGQSCVLPGVWAMIGAAATLAGVTRTTVSLAVIMFELTGSLTYTVPVMLGVLTAKTVADAIEPRSIYDLVIEIADLPYLDAKLEYIHASTPGDILDARAPIISLDSPNTIDSLRAKLASLYSDGTGCGFPIVAQEEGGGLRMYGYLASKELEHGLAQATRLGGVKGETPCTFRTASAVRMGVSTEQSRAQTPSGYDLSWLVDSAPIAVSLRSPMELCHEMFGKLGVRYLVVQDEKGLYRGVIEKVRYLKYLGWLEKTRSK